jgi:uncharacterized protein
MPIAGRLQILIASAAAIAVTALAGCDSTTAPPPGQNPRQVTVVGSGHVEGTPDTLTANVAISFVAADVTAAMNSTNQRQQAVIDALTGAGVDNKDISTTGVSLQPQYGTDGTVIVGYQASNTIDVKIRDLGSASRVLALIVSTGGDATRINSVSYSINDDSKLVKDARTRAFNDAKDRADQYAQLSGLKLGKVISISEVAGGGPIPPPTMPAPRAMATEVPLSPGQQTVSFSVTVAWELG